ncbi:hypothetical protein Pla175_16950 [Pirellulimonas nuda]|uniref:Uncharacterized protein n=1 Tax=Pirellulimonas nuda TaxID=2528009 RepID=A0A518DA08_9BACT|nr:hypothetical protein [Pirellulimonas nuda]QDU88320.1 hypothetical protein Pla175_16950 [Pirellulimonas nuda]
MPSATKSSFKLHWGIGQQTAYIAAQRQFFAIDDDMPCEIALGRKIVLRV